MVTLAPITIGPRRFAWGTRTYVMGIVNVTPDSFSGDGLVTEGNPYGTTDEDDEIARVQRAVVQARGFVEAGATFIDVGGESTRPGFAPLAVEEELRRVLPVIKALRET